VHGIKFNENNVCNFCTDFEARFKNESFEALSQRLKKIFDSMRGKGKYDCIVGLSGGKDSTYVLYLLTRKYNLKVLAVNFDNGFRSAEAIRNLENAVTILGVDYISVKPRWDLMHTLYRTFLLRAGEFCTPCNMGIDATIERIAASEKVRLLVSGNSSRLSAGIPGMSPAMYYDRRYFLNVLQNKMTLEDVRNVISRPYMAKAFGRILGRGPEVINLPDYIEWNPKDIIDTLQKKLGWQNSPGVFKHGDCLVSSVKDYLMRKKWGWSELTASYSAMIRNKQIGRAEALEKAVAAELDEEPAVMDYFLRVLNLTRKDIEEALGKNHTDFGNFRSHTLFQMMKKIGTLISKARRYR